MITVTSSAVDHIKQIISSRDKETIGIKVGISTKGCSGLSYTMQFVDEIDVLDHFRSLVKCCLSGPTLGSYSKLNPSSETYKRLLLEARTLQTNLFGYKTHSPTSAVQIYLSTSNCEPPIIIDTGASDSLTPLSSDFKNNLIQSTDLKSLKQVNGSTQVCGAGMVE